MSILIKFATRSRPTQFIRAMRNILQTTVTPYKVMVTCDEDDRLMNTSQIKSYVESRFKTAEMRFGRRVSKVEAINRDMDQSGDWEVLINFSDDMMFKVRAWDRIMLSRIRSVWGESTDFFAHFNDGYVGDRLPTMSIMGRAYFERDKYIYHPSYKSFSCDAEAMYVAMMRGRHHYFKDLLFKHEHPANSRMNRNDILYKTNSGYTAHDTKNYFSRLYRYFDEPSGHEIMRSKPELKKYLCLPSSPPTHTTVNGC